MPYLRCIQAKEKNEVHNLSNKYILLILLHIFSTRAWSSGGLLLFFDFITMDDLLPLSKEQVQQSSSIYIYIFSWYTQKIDTINLKGQWHSMITAPLQYWLWIANVPQIIAPLPLLQSCRYLYADHLLQQLNQSIDFAVQLCKMLNLCFNTQQEFLIKLKIEHALYYVNPYSVSDVLVFLSSVFSCATVFARSDAAVTIYFIARVCAAFI